MKGYYTPVVLLLTILAVLALFVFLGKRVPREQDITQTPQPETTAYDADLEKYSWEIETFITGLEIPWDLAFDDSGRLFITERPGRVKVWEKDSLITIASLDQVVQTGESGLTGLVLHPNFSQNGQIYLYYTYRSGGQLFNKVSGFIFKNNSLQNETIILDQIPGGTIHNGGRMRFGPDGKLWVLTGDGARPKLAQDRNSLAGKVLRLNEDGSVPQDNPVKNSPVFSLGHRNPQGLAWHPLTEELIITDHGETAHDEINLIKANGNYAWPEIKRCFSDDPRFENPILCSGNETYAPSGIASFGTNIWRLRNSFVFTGLRGQMLERIEVVNSQVVERETIIKGEYGRLRAVLIDKDGTIYVGTSNLDGRGQPAAGDDKILKITPKLKE